MADTKNLPTPAVLKDRFKAGSIPLQSDFADLIDMAAAGASATGVASGQDGKPGQGMRISSDGKLEPNLEPFDFSSVSDGQGVSPIRIDSSQNRMVVDLNQGLSANTNGLSVKPYNGIVVNDNGVGVAPDVIANAAAGAKAVGAYTGQDDQPGLGMQLSSNGKLELKVGTFNYGATGFMPVSVNTATNAPVIDLSYGMSATDTGLSIAPGKGIKVGNDGVSVDMAYVVPRGTIVMFWGSAVPEGWALCNGSNGTPDLRDRFIKGSSSVSTTVSTGGSKTNKYYPTGTVTVDNHTLTINEMPSHRHAIVQRASENYFVGSYHPLAAQGGYIDVPGVSDQWMAYAGGDAGHNHNATFKGADYIQDNEPQYFALAYIMKL